LGDASPRRILHVDLDAFFASVEVRDRPELSDKPIAVGYSGGQRGVVCAASYEARAFGVRAAMSTRMALARCPQLILVEPRHDRYAEASREVMEALGAWAPIIEQVSVDEAYLDLGGTEQLLGSLDDAARGIRRAVRAATGLTISVGGATSKVVAKVASGAAKPDGLLIVPPGDEARWLAPRKVGVIPGIGPVARETLRELEILTCGELAAAPDDHLLRRFGQHGSDLKNLARGIDDTPVDDGGERKSLGREMTLDDDVSDPAALETLLLGLVEIVAYALRGEGLLGRTVTLKLKDTEFQSFTRQVTLDRPSNLGAPIFAAARALLAAAAKGTAYRLIGISVADLGTDEQLGLFDAARSSRDRALTAAADQIRRKYGDDAVTRARLVEPVE
jgi:DNA polymerase-4